MEIKVIINFELFIFFYKLEVKVDEGENGV